MIANTQSRLVRKAIEGLYAHLNVLVGSQEVGLILEHLPRFRIVTLYVVLMPMA